MHLFFILQVVFLWHPKTYLPYRHWAVEFENKERDLGIKDIVFTRVFKDLE